MSSPVPLGYAPDVTRRRRTRVVAACLVGVLVLAVLGDAFRRWFPAVTSWPSRAYLHHRALSHALPPDTPVLDWQKLSEHSVRPDDVWQATRNRLLRRPEYYGRYWVTLFLHERLTPGGRRRLVALNLCPVIDVAGRMVLDADLRLFTPGTLRSPTLTELPVPPIPALPPDDLPPLPGYLGTTFSLGRVPPYSDFRLYPAQPDPADPAAFTLRYTLNGTPGSLTFRLADDDSVTVTTLTNHPLAASRPSTGPSHR